MKPQKKEPTSVEELKVDRFQMVPLDRLNREISQNGNGNDADHGTDIRK